MKSGVMEPKDAERCFNEVRNHLLEWVYIGEEPFLYYDRLLEIVRLAKNILNVPIWLDTNGFWGRSKEIAREKLMKLKKAGLTHFGVFVSSFIQNYVPLDHAINCLEAAEEVGFERVNAHSTFLESPDSSNRFDVATRDILKQLDLKGIGYTKGTPWFVGRAAETLTSYLPSFGIPQRRCGLGRFFPFWLGTDLKKPTGIMIEPSGYVTLCHGISIGNIKQTSLSKIVEEYDYSAHPIIKILEEEGPKGLLEIATKKGYVPKRGYVNECHLCYETRRHLHKHYPDHLSPQSYYEEA
jgi:MoaA/NifB/PqqE/SkfB family radical SAM enzyme